MANWTETSLASHRRLESLLDMLDRAIQQGEEFATQFRAAHDALRLHYLQEGVHWKRLAAPKITHQHEEVLELATAVEEALVDGQTRDALSIVKRFTALASHNLIEEERDWFPRF